MTSPDDHTTPTGPTDPTDTHTDTAGGPPSLSALLDTWQAWNGREVFERAAARARAAGEHQRAARLAELVARDREVAALDALSAQHELSSLLAGWQWHTVRAAREQGATWADIAYATRTDPEHARTAYLDTVDRQEHAAHRHGGMPFDDAADYRAAAGAWDAELRPDTPDHVVEEIEQAVARDDVDELAALRAAWWNPHHVPPVTVFEAVTDAELDRAAQAHAAAQRGDHAQARRLMGIDDAELAALLAAQATMPLHVQIAPGIAVPTTDEDGDRNHTVDEAVTALAPLLGSRTAAERAVTDYLGEHRPPVGPHPSGAVLDDDDLIAIAYPAGVDPWTTVPAAEQVPHPHTAVGDRADLGVAIDATDAETDALQAAQDAADRAFQADIKAEVAEADVLSYSDAGIAAVGDALPDADGDGEQAQRLRDRPWLAQGVTVDTAHVQVPDDRHAHGGADEAVAWVVMPEGVREKALRAEAEWAASGGPPRPDPARGDDYEVLAARVAALREQVTGRCGETVDAFGSDGAAPRREQLTRWHDDDATDHDTAEHAPVVDDDAPESGWSR